MTVRVLVNEEGNALDVVVMGDPAIIDSLDSYGFKEAAISGAQDCKFRPAFQNGKPVKVWVSFPYKFILHAGIDLK